MPLLLALVARPCRLGRLRLLGLTVTDGGGFTLGPAQMVAF